ncbi:hypothetical protein Bbelb_091280 [Branchiostoma belcheri]|nr:hypothetical protein Bbelb_091280 [Branchiostoma belcheri]
MPESDKIDAGGVTSARFVPILLVLVSRGSNHAAEPPIRKNARHESEIVAGQMALDCGTADNAAEHNKRHEPGLSVLGLILSGGPAIVSTKQTLHASSPGEKLCEWLIPVSPFCFTGKGKKPPPARMLLSVCIPLLTTYIWTDVFGLEFPRLGHAQKAATLKTT